MEKHEYGSLVVFTVTRSYQIRFRQELVIFSLERLNSVIFLHAEMNKKDDELIEARKRKQKTATFEERQTIRKEIHKLELAYSHLADKIAQEKKRLFEEKDREMKRLEKKLKLGIQKTCIAKAMWVME